MKKANVFQATVLAAGLAPAMGLAELPGALTGNVGVTNNYVWRGITQTNDGPAISGGLDYTHDSGLYAGTWISNVDFATPGSSQEVNQQYEQDYYGGFSGSSGDFSYDVGYVYFDYPLEEVSDFGEVYGSVGYSFLTLAVNFTTNSEIDDDAVSQFSEGDIYYKATLDFPLEDDLGLSITAGRYQFDDDGEIPEGGSAEADFDYNHYNAYLSKSTEMGSFSFGVEVNDLEGEFPTGQGADDPRFVASWSHSIDLM